MALGSETQIGPYKIVAPIGKGGIGEVCLAQHTTLHRKIAPNRSPCGLGLTIAAEFTGSRCFNWRIRDN